MAQCPPVRQRDRAGNLPLSDCMFRVQPHWLTTSLAVSFTRSRTESSQPSGLRGRPLSKVMTRLIGYEDPVLKPGTNGVKQLSMAAD